MSPNLLHAVAMVPVLSWTLLSGCCASSALSPSVAAELDHARQRLVATLRSARLTDPDRLVAHASHTCSLLLEGRSYPVVDLQELVPGATTPRGVNAILLLSPELELIRRIEYTTERPLFCVKDKLYVWGDLLIDGVPSEGNELSFADGGRSLSLRHVEASEVPAPRTAGDRVR